MRHLSGAGTPDALDEVSHAAGSSPEATPVGIHTSSLQREMLVEPTAGAQAVDGNCIGPVVSRGKGADRSSGDLSLCEACGRSILNARRAQLGGNIQNVSLLLSLREACPRRLRGTGTRWAAWRRLQNGQRIVDADLYPLSPVSEQKTEQTLSNKSGPGAQVGTGQLGADSSATGSITTPFAHGRNSVIGTEPRSQLQLQPACTCSAGRSSTFQDGHAGANTDRQLKTSYSQPTRRVLHLGLDASTGLNVWAESDSLRHYVASYCPLLPPPRSTIAAAFSPDGTTLASTQAKTAHLVGPHFALPLIAAAHSGDHTVKVVSCSSAQCLRTLTGHRRTPWVVRYHPTAPDIVASGSLDHEVRLWSLSTVQCLKVHTFYRPIASLAFHARGDLLAVASGRHLYIWEHTKSGDDGQPVIILKTRRSLRAVHFHPHGAPLLLTAEVSALEPSDSTPSPALSNGYLDYPPPTVHFIGAEEPAASPSPAAGRLPPWQQPAVEGGPFWSGGAGTLPEQPGAAQAVPHQEPAPERAAEREAQQAQGRGSPFQGSQGRRQQAGRDGSNGTVQQQQQRQQQAPGSGLLPQGQGSGGGEGSGAWSDWLWSVGSQATAGIPLLSQLAPAVHSQGGASREPTAMVRPGAAGQAQQAASGHGEAGGVDQLSRPSIGIGAATGPLVADEMRSGTEHAAGAGRRSEAERPSGGRGECEGQDAAMRLRDDSRAALRSEGTAHVAQSSWSGWRLFQGGGAGARQDAMADDPMRESLSQPPLSGGLPPGPGAGGQLPHPSDPSGPVDAEMLLETRRDEELFKEDEGEGEEDDWEDQMQADPAAAPGRHARGAPGMAAHESEPVPGATPPVQAHLGTQRRTDGGLGQDRGREMDLPDGARGRGAGEFIHVSVLGAPAAPTSPGPPTAHGGPDGRGSGPSALHGAAWGSGASLATRDQGGAEQGSELQESLPGSRGDPEAGQLGSAGLQLLGNGSMTVPHGSRTWAVHDGARGRQEPEQGRRVAGPRETGHGVVGPGDTGRPVAEPGDTGHRVAGPGDSGRRGVRPGGTGRTAGGPPEVAERDAMAGLQQHTAGRTGHSAWRHGQQPPPVQGAQPLSLLSVTQQQLLQQHHQATNPEVPCTVKLKLWQHSEGDPKRELDPATACRLTISHAVLCSEMGAHFSPCGRFLAACVACIPKESTAHRAESAEAGAAGTGLSEPPIAARAGPRLASPSRAGIAPLGNAAAPGLSHQQPTQSQDWRDIAVRARTEAADLGAAVAAVRLEHPQEPQAVGNGPMEWNTYTQMAGHPPQLDPGGGGTWGGYEQRVGRSMPRGQGRLGPANAASEDMLAPSTNLGGASVQGALPPPAPAKAQGSIVYELRIFSVEGPLFGEVLASRGVRAAHCLTSIQFSPTSSHLLLAYGRRHHSLLRSIVVDGRVVVPIYTILETEAGVASLRHLVLSHDDWQVYRVADMSLIHILTSAEDEVNVASFHPTIGTGFVYGTKEGKLRLFQHSRQAPATVTPFGLAESINLTDESGSPWWTSLNIESGTGA